jgi:predicted MPP superfamily phosphohydrolase
MLPIQPWATLLLTLLGNCGFWLFWFNRVNSTGWPRRRIKRIEKLCMLLCFLIPTIIFVVEWRTLSEWLMQPAWVPSGATWFTAWMWASLTSLCLLGIPWIASRRFLIPPPHLISQRVDRLDVNEIIQGCSAANTTTRWLARLPGNEITQLEITRKKIKMPRPIAGIDGLTIGHLSDLHFTGQLSPEHYHEVVDQFLKLAPDLIVISGDIIDFSKCLSWIEPILGRLQSPLGCVYILGNHERRLRSIQPLIDAMDALGHHDLGQSDLSLTLPTGAKLWLTGSEEPWFSRRLTSDGCDRSSQPLASAEADTTLRIGVSHSPDQIGWARHLGLDLMLAGHTHGGQVRFPLIGPIVAPSRYGSRFASGVFYLEPTLLHVSRGIAGTHPLRWRCCPEICLLELNAH